MSLVPTILLSGLVNVAFGVNVAKILGFATASNGTFEFSNETPHFGAVGI
jgi:hypothetical protein